MERNRKAGRFYDTDLIIIIGQNPGTNSPRMLSALTKGKKNGAKLWRSIRFRKQD
jgi:anaerobic selenocysteine-containing dehydrogenase